MKKVYIVTRGEYEDYHIEAIFPTRDSAERYCAVHWDDNRYDPPKIEEHDLESPDILKETKVYYAIFFTYKDRLEKIIHEPIKPRYYVRLGITPYKTYTCRDFCDIIGCIPIKNKDISEGSALKIIYDHIEKFKAEESGL